MSWRFSNVWIFWLGPVLGGISAALCQVRVRELYYIFSNRAMQYPSPSLVINCQLHQMFLQLLLSGIHLQRAKRGSVIADKRQNSHRWRRRGWRQQSWRAWRDLGQWQGDEGRRRHQDVRSQRESSGIQCQLQGSPHTGASMNYRKS